jgi:hypothetical protein
MLRRPRQALSLLALALLTAALVGTTGCGSKDELSVSEGEPVDLGGLSYNVQLSRFLNIDDTEDRFYLTGRKPLPPDKSYFGVFVQIKNENGDPQPIPSKFEIVDTQNNHYFAQKPQSDFSLDLGGNIEGHASAPVADTPAQSGTTEGALILFVLNRDITENRPLDLIVPSPAGGESATIKLDI